jgi:two-component system chemotaxis sensor kinase CheA
VDTLRRLVQDALGGVDELRPEDVELLGALALEATGASPAEPAAEPVPEASAESVQQVPDDRKGSGRRATDDPAGGERRSVRVSVEKLDRLVTLMGEIAVSRGRLGEALVRAGRNARMEDVAEAHRSADRLLLDLQEEVMRARMLPLGPMMRQFARTVRDVATATSKQVDFEIEGEDVDVDMSVVEHLRDPLTHILRNAVDHGIEAPAARVEAGKEPRGRIVMRAWYQAGFIAVQVQDDGAGLDRRRIVERARTLGYGADIEQRDNRDLFRLILEPGFSTASQVTEISGRGVGMDVVQRNLEALRGSIAIDSRLGSGTTFTIHVPLTLAVVRGLSVATSGQTYVVPLDHVVECLEFPQTSDTTHGGRGVLDLRGQPLPYIRLRDALQLGDDRPADENVVVIEHDGHQIGLVVDSLLGESETVIKPLSRVLGEVPCLAGTAITRDGQVALILEVGRLVREAMRESGPASA